MVSELASQMGADETRAEILKAVNARRTELREAAATARADLAALQAENEQKRTEWENAAAQARQSLQPAPEPPQLEDGHRLQELLLHIRNEEAGLYRAEREALAGAAVKVEEAWQAQRATLDAQAADLATKVDTLVGQYAEWYALLHECRAAVENDSNSQILNGPSTRMRARPDRANVVTLAANGVDLLKPTPLPVKTAGW
ncbi:hypothetical protein [Rarobacter incanus]|nr:hypothetical protein [Rarobacter incanus]